MLEDAVLVDAGFMGEGVRADDRLVRLHRKTGDRDTSLLTGTICVVSMPCRREIRPGACAPP